VKVRRNAQQDNGWTWRPGFNAIRAQEARSMTLTFGAISDRIFVHTVTLTAVAKLPNFTKTLDLAFKFSR